MKCISIWQPWASLIVHGMKFFETRSWSAPRSLMGQTLGIASTKHITPDQRAAYADPNFQRLYALSGLPPLDELPRGMLLGTVSLDSVEIITEEFLDGITIEERAFGWHEPGNYAWRLRDARSLRHPIPVSGKQGIWDYRGFDHPIAFPRKSAVSESSIEED